MAASDPWEIEQLRERELRGQSAVSTGSAAVCRTGNKCVLVKLGNTERHLSQEDARRFAKMILDAATAALTCTKCGREIDPNADAYQEYENNGKVWAHHLVCPSNNQDGRSVRPATG